MKKLGLDINQLTKRFGDIIALDGVTLSIKQGYIVGLLGQNGAGKSTMVRLLSGVMRPTSGSANLIGFDLKNDLEDVKRITGLLPEEYALYEKLTIYEYIEFLATLYDMDTISIKKKFEELASLLRIDSLKYRLIETLSKGQKQKVALLASLIHDPQILFLDEPLANLDVSAQKVVRNLISTYKDESRIILIATHLLSNVEEICDYVVIIDHGKIKFSGTLETFITNSNSIEEAYLDLLGE